MLRTPHERYQELQRYVGWTDDDAHRVVAAGLLLRPALPLLVDDFYAEIQRHPEALHVIRGGSAQIERLKGTLTIWLRELFAGRYDADYVERRWRVGWRHVEIGLDQVYTNAALSRLRRGLSRELRQRWDRPPDELPAALASLDTLLDLDLAIIEDAYQAEYLARKQRQGAIDAIRALVEAVPGMIVIFRSDHRLLYLNPFAAELTGYQPAEVLGRDFLARFVPPPHQLPFAQSVRRLLIGGQVRGVEHPVSCRDGSCRWLLWNAQLLPDYEGAPAVLAIGQDITELRLAQERTVQAERLAAIGQMTTGLAHESGNALARSQACLEMLALEMHDRPEALALLQRAQNAQDHLQQLYDEVRNYAASPKLEPELWPLDAVWRQAWGNLAVRRQGRDVRLLEDTRGVDLRCRIDPFRVEQVFRNVLENALAACQDPVEIRVCCADAQLGGAAAVRVSVRDNGPGLTPEVRQRLFEPFFTTKTKGTGLGMAIARRAVEAHEGHIEADPDGPGAAIHITLPRGHDPSGDPS